MKRRSALRHFRRRLRSVALLLPRAAKLTEITVAGTDRVTKVSEQYVQLPRQLLNRDRYSRRARRRTDH